MPTDNEANETAFDIKNASLDDIFDANPAIKGHFEKLIQKRIAQATRNAGDNNQNTVELERELSDAAKRIEALTKIERDHKALATKFEALQSAHADLTGKHHKATAQAAISAELDKLNVLPGAKNILLKAALAGATIGEDGAVTLDGKPVADALKELATDDLLAAPVGGGGGSHGKTPMNNGAGGMPVSAELIRSGKATAEQVNAFHAQIKPQVQGSGLQRPPQNEGK